GFSPDDPAILKLAADVELQLRGPAAAEPLLARCLELQPEFPAARLRYATILLIQGKSRLALAQTDELLRRGPVHIAIRLLHCTASLRSGDFVRATTEYERLLQETTDMPGAWMGYGQALRVLGRDREGSAAYQRAIALLPGF